MEPTPLTEAASQGYAEGFKAGYQAGHLTGYDEGKTTGYDNCRERMYITIDIMKGDDGIHSAFMKKYEERMRTQIGNRA